MNYQETRKEQTATEQLGLMAKQKETEYENLLLKEALAISSERCETLLEELIVGQQTAEENRQRDFERLNERVERITKSNESLRRAFDSRITELVDDVRSATVVEVKKSLKNVMAEMTEVSGQIVENGRDYIREMQSKVFDLEQIQKKLFRAEGFKSFLFWMGQVVSIVTLALLLYVLFGG